MVSDELGNATYEYLPIFDGYNIVNDKEYVSTKNPEVKRKATWHTAGEMRTWVDDASTIQNLIDKYSTSMLAEMREQAKNGTEKIHAVIGRRTVDDREEYCLSWSNEKVIFTWNTRVTICQWAAANGEKLVNDYDNVADQIIRLFLNQRNKYGKSAYISACEFGKTEIAELMSGQRWNCKAEKTSI